ncbi:RNase III inhibitor [Chlamydia serpentis]|uniref:RNase III inhibitor n=1 Tax=Chlamydia serpentis TaxID=1967782 RepID=A0A2R8FB87_9CHLA|nr:macro domain-containing protein [Chlamydia serpentis]SPN73507.1 RNase III inhibitor [Chlamydia serpentis]
MPKVKINTNPSNINIEETSSLEHGIERSQQSVVKIFKIAIAVLSIVIAIGSGITAGILGTPLLLIATFVALAIAAVSLYLLLKQPSQPKEEIPSREFPRETPPRETPSPELKFYPRETPSPEVEVFPEESPSSVPTASLEEYQKELKTNWTLLPNLSLIDSSWTTTTENQPYYAWRLNNSRVTLIVTTGDISEPRVQTKGKVMIVNAANAAMARELGGTNLVLSNKTSATCWQNTQTRNGSIPLGSPLVVGECRSAPWINRDNSSNDDKPGSPQFLAQLLGPKYGEIKPEELSSTIQQAYLNCLYEADYQGADIVQLPLISCGIFSPKGTPERQPVDPLNTSSPENQFNLLHNAWLDTVKTGLLKALRRFSGMKPSKDITVIVTDYNAVRITPSD